MLGKMVQPESKNSPDGLAPYLRAAHVQPQGRLIELPEQPMWFSPGELRVLDLRLGDVVIVEGGAGYGRSAFIRDDLPGWGFQNSIIRLRPFTERADGRFIDYALQDALSAGRVDLVTSTATIPHFTADKASKFEISAPPLDEQRAIADFLDRETAQIDALVAKQNELVGLLRERRARSREVLSSRVNERHRLRWSLVEIDQRAGTRASDLPLMSVSIDWGVRRRDVVTSKPARAEELTHYKVCLVNDIVVNRMRAFQGALGVAPEDGVVSPDYAVLRAAAGVSSRWLAELMRTKAFVGEMTLRLRGIGGTESGNVRTPRINTDDLLDIRVDIPEPGVQASEMKRLVAETVEADALIAKAQEHIALAKERRAALITAAVTGQCDVRTARKAG